MKERKNLYLSMVGWGLLLAGALSFSSCVDDELDNGLQTTGKNIGFNASYSRGTWEPDQTRSAKEKQSSIRCESSDGDFSVDVTVEDGIRSFQSEQVESRGTQIAQKGGWNYRVGAYYTTDKEATNLDSKTINFFTENTDGGISIASDADNFTTNYYWPPVGTMKFFAVAPADVTSLSIPSVNDINTPTITYTIPENVADQKDIMVAQTTADCPQNTAVGLQFQHLLAAVQFKVGKMQFIKINSLIVKGVKGGEVEFKYSTSNNVWEQQFSTTATYDLSSFIYDTSGLKEGDEITSNNNNSLLLVAPQILNGAKLKVNWTETITQLTHEKEIDLSGTWVAGKTTIYSLNISGTNFGTVEIPRPDDQDAHYIMLHMPYNMGNILDNENIVSVKAIAQWKKDENGNDISNNTSSKTAISLKSEVDLFDTQLKGYWTDKQYEQTVIVNKVTGDKTYSAITIANNNILGSSELIITDKKGIIVLMIEENNGYTDREGELILTATLDTGVNIIIGEGYFKQLCPSWNEVTNNIIGVERLEDVNAHPYGFAYNRKVTYKLNWLGQLSAIASWFAEAAIESIITPDNNFITFNHGKVGIGGAIFGWEGLSSIVIDYSALNKIQSKAADSDGTVNSQQLYNSTGSISFDEIETTLNNNDWLDSPTVNPTGSKTPEDYAAFIALSYNRMYELKTITKAEGEDDAITYKAFLYKDGEYGLVGYEIIEWYLPSSEEAKTLKETGTGTESTPISPLNGEYWSSTAGSDTDAQAHSYTYTNNTFGSINTTKGRMENLKVRAVRKKP